MHSNAYNSNRYGGASGSDNGYRALRLDPTLAYGWRNWNNTSNYDYHEVVDYGYFWGRYHLDKTFNFREGEIESFISCLSLAKKFNKQYKKNLKTNEIFELYRKHDLDAENLIDNFKVNLAMSLANIINILDPDCFVFGGGVSNEIDFLSEIETIVRKFVTGREYEGVFLKPKYGDASGVRGAARLGRKSIY